MVRILTLGYWVREERGSEATGLVLSLLVEGKGEGPTAGSHTLLRIEMTRGCVKTSDAEPYRQEFLLP